MSASPAIDGGFDWTLDESELMTSIKDKILISLDELMAQEAKLQFDEDDEDNPPPFDIGEDIFEELDFSEQETIYAPETSEDSMQPDINEYD